MLKIGNCVNCVNIYGPSYCKSFRLFLGRLHGVASPAHPASLNTHNPCTEYALILINYVWQYANWKVTFILRLAAPDSLHTQQANKAGRTVGGGGRGRGHGHGRGPSGWLSFYLFIFFLPSAVAKLIICQPAAGWQSALWHFPNCQPQARSGEGKWQGACLARPQSISAKTNGQS